MSRKEKMKVYHGIPKSPTDEHTLLYASFDGTIIPEVGEYPLNVPTISYNQGYTGLQSIFSTPINYSCILDNPKELTIDFFVKYTNRLADSIRFFNGDKQLLYIYQSNVTDKIFIRTYTESGELSDGVNLSTLPISTNSPIHIRIILKETTVSSYVNGSNFTSLPLNISRVLRTTNSMTLGGSTNSYSDLHISNIDRGNYFPNLPQDFIEGKAIIKERLGQQQIKGDPLISQTTELIVPALTDEIEKISYYDANTSTRYYYNNPELGTGLSDTWGSGARIIIKGLNNEIISGVIDSDTALCKILKHNDRQTFFVDDVSKLSIGDMVKSVMPNLTSDSSSPRTITNIDTVNKTITLDTAYGGTSDLTGFYFFETTVSSSSPIVKTNDGTVVNGTWTGLGTNVATFTLGSNTGLAGKDLVVTYSLNIPQGNSHFPELPSDIERAYTETGIEMKPVSEIVIEDDFKGKTIGNTSICPHIYKTSEGKSLVVPTSGTEVSTNASYELLSKVDSNCSSRMTSTNTNIPQQLFSFDIIKIVESKIGEIPSSDKVQWLKDNIYSYTCIAYGKGTCPTGNKYYLNNYCVDETRWYGDPKVHFQSQISEVSYRQISPNWIAKSIDSKGYTHFIVYTDTSNGNIFSLVETDYVKIQLKLKIDTTFTTLYCDNKRAREDKCNPVLIQKETKTVKRYIPSKECFVTESLAYKNNIVESSTTDTNCDRGLFKLPYIYLTNYGTSDLVDSSYLLGVQPLIPRLPLNPNYKPYQFSLGEMPVKSLEGLPNRNKVYLAKVNSVIDGLPNSTNQNKFYSEGKIRDVGEQLSDAYPMALRFGLGLVSKNGEMYMKVRSCVPNSVNYSKSSILSMSTAFDMEYLYKLPNRPLIK